MRLRTAVHAAPVWNEFDVAQGRTRPCVRLWKPVQGGPNSAKGAVVVELPDDPWQVDATAFPQHAALGDKLAFCLNYACLAPTGHATRPFLFRIGNSSVEVYANGTREHPVVDPEDRDVVTSCGAAIGHLEVALRHFGFVPRVMPADQFTPERPLARVAVTGRHTPQRADERLFRAMPVRGPAPHPVVAAEDAPADPMAACREAAEACGVAFRVVRDKATLMRVADLVSEGNRRQFADPRFPRELAAWTRAHRMGGDPRGARGYGMPDRLSAQARMMTRSESLGAADEGAAGPDDLPALALVATAMETPTAWLSTGRALSRIHLTLATAGLTNAYLTEPVAMDALRPGLRTALGEPGFPQLVLQISQGTAIPPAGRQAVADLLLRW